jgi:hypothetical protein
MRLDDLPALSAAPIHLGAIPAVLIFIAAIGYVVECKDGRVADDLDQRVDELVPLSGDLPSAGFVVSLEGLTAVNATIDEGIEVDDVWGTDFDEAGWISSAPSVKGSSFQIQYGLGWVVTHGDHLFDSLAMARPAA